MDFADYECPYLTKTGAECRGLYKTLKELNKHIGDVHKGNRNVLCEHLVNGVPCNQILFNEGSLRLHEERRHTPKKCPKCGEEFPDAFAVDKHYEEVHQRCFCCTKKPRCKRRFSSKADEEEHQCTPVTRMIQCTFHGECGKEIKGRPAYITHLLKVHRIQDLRERQRYLPPDGRKFDQPSTRNQVFICSYAGICNATNEDEQHYAVHLSQSHHLTTSEARQPYLDNLVYASLIPAPAPPAPVPNTSRAAAGFNASIHVDPPNIDLDALFCVNVANPETRIFTEDRIQVRYRPQVLLPEVVYQCLDPEYMQPPNFIRPRSQFLPHPDLDATEQLGFQDYWGTNLDRGHMARRRNHWRHGANHRATFYYPFIAPQHPLFNRLGLWSKAESHELDFINRMSIVHNYSGPGLEPFQGVTAYQIGRMWVPSLFYKVLLGKRNGGHEEYELEAYAFPHEVNGGIGDLRDYYIDLDTLNNLLGFEDDSSILKDLDWEQVRRINNRYV